MAIIPMIFVTMFEEKTPWGKTLTRLADDFEQVFMNLAVSG